jgi:hypothetical protein
MAATMSLGEVVDETITSSAKAAFSDVDTTFIAPEEASVGVSTTPGKLPPAL